MSGASDATGASAPPARLVRDRENGVVAGVCSGIARRLEIDPLIVRLAVAVVTIASGGLLAVAYAVAWAVVPAEGESLAASTAPEDGGTRGGAARSASLAVGVGLAVLTVLLVFRELGIWWSDAIVWPGVLAATGAILLWRQWAPTSGASEAPLERVGRPPMLDRGETSVTDAAPSAAGARPARLASLYRGGFGIALVVGAGVLFLYVNGALDRAGDALLGAVVVLTALGLVLAPLWWRLGRDLVEERSRRIRASERAALAGHLHDSVLQTLAMVQRESDDPAAVARLARSQERELRAWLAGEGPREGSQSVVGALERVADEIERGHRARIEVVGAGDRPLEGERLEALVQAAREAVLNAAKFAGEDGPIDVFCEARPDGVEVFVRDRGPGFDPEQVPEERHGIRESIVARVERHGGEAEIRSEPEGGTEVRLSMPGGAER